MGLAKAAELNHYPGPLHVLELAGELTLSREQIDATAALFRSMKHAAMALGSQIITRESRLDALFADSRATPESLDSALLEIATLQAKLRAVHLKAHIEQRSILSMAQALRYDQ
eukprot:UN05881